MVKIQNFSVSNSVLCCHIIPMMDTHCGDIYMVVRPPPPLKSFWFFFVLNIQDRCMKICDLLENKSSTTWKANKILRLVSCQNIKEYQGGEMNIAHWQTWALNKANVQLYILLSFTLGDKFSTIWPSELHWLWHTNNKKTIT